MLTLADFRRGRKFRVIKPGCSLVGWLSIGGFSRHYWEEIVRPLAVGCVLTCNGPGSDRHRLGLGRHGGRKVVQWRNEKGEWTAHYSFFVPCALRRDDEPLVIYPDPTCLEPIEEPPEAKRRWWQRR
jgi:hypothetical protein